MLLSFINEGVKKEYQSKSGGLNDKGRAHYNSKGHNLKKPVSSKEAKKSPKSAGRRKSFCSRMGGQKEMHNIDCREDPDKAICKSLKRWDCNESFFETSTTLLFEQDDTSEYQEYYLELVVVGPKTNSSSRKIGAYLLPHKYHEFDDRYRDNPAYLEKCVVFDLTNDAVAKPSVQLLLPWLLSKNISYFEIAVQYEGGQSTETHDSWYDGAKVSNGPKHTETISDYSPSGGYLISHNPRHEFKFNYDVSSQLFQDYYKEIKNS